MIDGARYFLDGTERPAAGALVHTWDLLPPLSALRWRALCGVRLHPLYRDNMTTYTEDPAEVTCERCRVGLVQAALEGAA